MKTCLDCKVLPPFSIQLCPLHTAAEDFAHLARQVAALAADLSAEERSMLAERYSAEAIALLARIGG